MSTLAAKWRKRRRTARNHREFNAALERAGSPAMRDELLALANARSQHLFR